jgi:osmoprotectant transport system ATP-binding protein
MIELADLVKRFPGSEHPAVDRLTLTIPEGEVCVLIGPSGCGKTTTMRIVNRMIEPDGGRVTVAGRNVMDVDPVELRRHIGYVIQQIGLFPHWSIANNVATVPRLLGWDKARIDIRVRELLTMVRLEEGEFGGRFPQELSGGQRQRVALARALAVRPHILLLDEPFGALDPVTREAVAADVREIHHKLGLTTLMVTHDMTEALLMADRIAVMRDGHLVQVGTPRELVAHPADDFVAQLIETPRRRARALAETLHT